nr:MAG TPA: hypothetical protein [Caudoviricetes sp.]DAY51017.1 MAG TPA: hypothetical protein [Caudoviricetes sp.]
MYPCVYYNIVRTFVQVKHIAKKYKKFQIYTRFRVYYVI